MEKIQLTQGKVVLIDDEDFEIVNKYKWCAWKSKCGVWYAVTNMHTGGKCKSIRMHRLLLGLSDPNKLSDHIDGNGLNNQRFNLRTATREQNNMNKRSRLDSTSRYLGVFKSSFFSNYGEQIRYQAQIKHKGKSIYLGSYKNQEEAAKAYDNNAKYYFGEFANLNFKN